MDNEKTLDFYKDLLDHIKDGVYFVDKDRKITFWNKASELISGFAREDVVDHYCYDNILNHVDDEGNRLCHNGCPLHKTLQDGLIRENVVYLQHRDGQRVAVDVHVMPVYEGSEIIGAVETYSEVKLADDSDDLTLRMYLDELTLLPNRLYIEELLKSSIHGFNSIGRLFSTAILEIDSYNEFVTLNGQEIADKIINLMTTIIKNSINTSDIVGRFDENKFLIIFTHQDVDQVESLLKRLKMIIRQSSLRQHDELHVSVSIGATTIKKGDSIEQLLERTFKMLDQSKKLGKNRLSISH